MEKYKTWTEFFNGEEFKENVMDYLINCGENSEPYDYQKFKFNNQWYVYGDMGAVLDSFVELVIEPITKDNCYDLEWDAWKKEIEIAENPKTLKIVRETIKLNKLQNDF